LHDSLKMSAPSIKPREYQQKIAEAASQANTLVVLPTGLGKTLIAVLIAKIRLEKFPQGKIVVLAPTKPLALQHLNSFKEMLSLGPNDSALLTGESPPEERSYLWRRSKFVFATPQTVKNDVRYARVDLNDVVLLVFDEAHRSVKDYSYTELARLYKETGWTPLIVGLTASPGGSREKINEITTNLFIERVEARSEEDEEVRGYVEKTEFEGRRVALPKEYGQLLLVLRDIYNEKVNRLIQTGFLPKTRLSKKMLLQARSTMLARLKAGAGNKGYIFGALINQAQAIAINHAIELAETQGVEVLLKYFKRQREKPEQGKSVAALMKDPRWVMAEEEAQRLKGVEYPKLTELRTIVKQQLELKPDSKMIIFTQYRDTIESIIDTLAKDGVAGQRFVGQANKADSEGMDQKKQTDVLERFAEGDFKILVSSSIGEEGLHVPDVDVVVFYEAVPSEIRAIQRKGRTGRTMRGKVIVLIAEGTVDEAYFFSSLRREKLMKSLVSPNREGPKTDEDPPRSRREKKTTTLLDFVD
jgi:ERCC4-related helicase